MIALPKTAPQARQPRRREDQVCRLAYRYGRSHPAHSSKRSAAPLTAQLSSRGITYYPADRADKLGMGGDSIVRLLPRC